jgi:hypothetical protein
VEFIVDKFDSEITGRENQTIEKEEKNSDFILDFD